MSKSEENICTEAVIKALIKIKLDALNEAIITGREPADVKADMEMNKEMEMEMNMKINKEIITNAGIEHGMEVNFVDVSSMETQTEHPVSMLGHVLMKLSSMYQEEKAEKLIHIEIYMDLRKLLLETTDK